MLSNLAGDGWVMVDPPAMNDDENVIARYDGSPIKAGFLMSKKVDDGEMFNATYRSGQYNLEVKIDFQIGRGQVKVTQAEGYDGQE